MLRLLQGVDGGSHVSSGRESTRVRHETSVGGFLQCMASPTRNDRNMQRMALGHIAQGHLRAIDVIDMAGDIRELRTMSMRTLFATALGSAAAADDLIGLLRREFNCHGGKRSMHVGWAWHPHAGPARRRLLTSALSGGGLPLLARIAP